jgi:hypothetical protein
MNESFLRLTSRLHFIQFCSNHYRNIQIWHYLSVLENYIYGVKSQYDRIRENISKMIDFNSLPHSQMESTQVSLDVYYYTLTWDKISKTYDKFKRLINSLQKTEPIPKLFNDDFRELKRRLDHLLGEFRNEVRNEYEHPSLEPNRVGNITDWGSLFVHNNGDIKVHVGKDQFSVVQKGHVDRLISIWIDLIDVFLKHFSDKPSSHDLIHLKNHIEQHIDDIIDEYNNYLHDNRKEEANGVIGQFLRAEIFLTKEGIPLSQDAIAKFHSILFGRESIN